MIRRWGPGQWVLRGTIVGGVLGAMLTTGLLGVFASWWLVLVVGSLAVGFAVLPDSSVGTVALGLVIAWWGFALRDGLQPEALLATGGLVVAHVAATLAALGPDDLAIDPATVRLWTVRGVAVLLLAPPLWLLAVAVRDAGDPGGVWVVGLVAALVGTTAAGVVHSATRGE